MSITMYVTTYDTDVAITCYRKLGIGMEMRSNLMDTSTTVLLIIYIVKVLEGSQST